MENKDTLLSRVAGGQSKKFTPYFNQTYTFPKQVQQLYEVPNIKYHSPAFLKQDESFTTHEEMMKFLINLSGNNERVQLKNIGYSLENRQIPMLILSMSDHEQTDFTSKKPTVWLQAQIHGDEPAAGEAALIMAEQLANGSLGDEILRVMDVIIIPRMNPDSMFYFQRNAVTGLNGNRDHLNLNMRELQGIHQMFNKYNPEVVIDAHEYGIFPQFEDIGLKGSIKYADVLIQTGKNLNIPPVIRKETDDWFKQSIFSALNKDNFSYDTYYTVADSTGKRPILYEGDTDATNGRNAFALKPSMSILVETLGIGLGRENFLRRVTSQVITHSTILRTVKEKSTQIKQTIKKARKDISQSGRRGIDNGSIILKHKLNKVPNQTIDVIDIAQGEIIGLPVTYFSATKAVATLKRQRPNAYLLPPGFHDIVQRLKDQGVKVDRLKADQILSVECFQVVKREVVNEGSQPMSQLTTNITTEDRLFLAGSYLIRSDQTRALIASLALEPESKASYFTHNLIATYVKKELPVYRYMGQLNKLESEFPAK